MIDENTGVGRVIGESGPVGLTCVDTWIPKPRDYTIQDYDVNSSSCGRSDY